jgi:hypothetical protein
MINLRLASWYCIVFYMFFLYIIFIKNNIDINFESGVDRF